MITDIELQKLLLNTRFVSYGTNHFDYEGFRKIQNDKGFSFVNKPLPHTGLWASPEKSSYGWFNWCSDNNYHNDKSYWQNFFVFHLLGRARVMYIDSLDDFQRLMKPYFRRRSYECVTGTHFAYSSINFEAMRKKYDAVWLTVKGEEQTRIPDINDISYSLYGWDCESLLVLNRGVVVEVDNQSNIELQHIEESALLEEEYNLLWDKYYKIIVDKFHNGTITAESNDYGEGFTMKFPNGRQFSSGKHGGLLDCLRQGALMIVKEKQQGRIYKN